MQKVGRRRGKGSAAKNLRIPSPPSNGVEKAQAKGQYEIGNDTLETASVALSLAACMLGMLVDRVMTNLMEEAAAWGIHSRALQAGSDELPDTPARHVPNSAFHLGLLIGLVVFGLMTVAAPITHVIAVSKYRHFSYFQPFTGGPAFVALSMAAWLLYALSLLLGFCFLYMCHVRSAPVYGVLSIAGICGFGAQLLVILSLRFFEVPETKAHRPERWTEFRWNSVACFSLVILSIIPLTWFVIVEVFSKLSASSEESYFTEILEPFISPNVTTYLLAICAVFASAPITHGVAGRKKHNHAGHTLGGFEELDEVAKYRWFQPFQGGRLFCILQMLGWTFYSFGLLFAGAFVYMAVATQRVPNNMLALLGGLGGFIAQVLVLFSLQYFERAVNVGENMPQDPDDVCTVPTPLLSPIPHAPPSYDARSKRWGRHMEATWASSISALLMMMCTPIVVFYFFVSCDVYDCALSGPLLAMVRAPRGFQNLLSSSAWQSALFSHIVVPSAKAIQILSLWIPFQLALWYLVPGPRDKGQLTPGGHVLEYKVNGFNCWIVTHIAFFLGGFVFDLFSPALVYENWGALVTSLSILGFILTFFAYAKARLAPTHANDAKLSGSFFYDLFMGVELNPRFGNFDFKLFFNGRPGIIAWSIINLSNAAAQFNQHGMVTNSMVAVTVLQNIYIVDFFWNEGWYLRTIDIAHDHFGFYLAWGDLAWLPFMYTLQGFYLVSHPVQLSTTALLACYALGIAGYYIFRSVNHQKDMFRASKGNCTIWGKPAEYITVRFTQADGQIKESILLCSGWWGLSRHFNYVGDLMISLSFCLVCGFEHLFPFFYIIYMTILLVHRVYRDDSRCRGKYGKMWDEYCRRVPYKILPGVF